MAMITGLKTGKRRERRINVFLDGTFALSLEADVVVKAGLRVGQSVTPGELDGLMGADQYQRCLNAGARFIGYRPRSESEVRQRLVKYGYDGEVIEKVIRRLKELELVNDAAFARSWTENRETLSPRSRRMVQLELRRKGLDETSIEDAVTTIDEEDGAYRAAAARAPRLAGDDDETFRRKLAGFLTRRGFTYGVIKTTLEKIWKEYRNDRK